MQTYRRLWAAVIHKTIEDAEVIVISMAENIEKYGCTSDWRERSLQQIYREIQSDWFSMICGYVDLHSDHVYRKIQKLERANGIQARPVIATSEFKQMVRDNTSRKI